MSLCCCRCEIVDAEDEPRPKELTPALVSDGDAAQKDDAADADVGEEGSGADDGEPADAPSGEPPVPYHTANLPALERARSASRSASGDQLSGRAVSRPNRDETDAAPTAD